MISVCSLDGCERKVYAKGLCNTDYAYLLRHGTLVRRVVPHGRCSVPGCASPHSAKGLCDVHYQRMRRRGALELPPRNNRSVPIAERFWRKVAKGSPDECWEWQGGRFTSGYGAVSAEHTRRPLRAHRVSYELANGPIPDGLVVRHRCDNPPCVNPNHLELGTPADNTHDMITRGRHRAGKKVVG